VRPLGRHICLGFGLAALAVTVLPPLSTASRVLFSAHMLQHLAVIVIAAPLLVLSRAPARALAWPGLRLLARPAPAWIAFVAVFLLWHWPLAFRWAARGEATRLLEHASILFTAILFWNVALAAGGRLSQGARALFVMTAAVATDLPGVLMVFAPQPYSTMPHENAAAWGITAMQDQQIAGLLMWVPANIVFFSFATWLFAQWIADDRDPSTQQRRLVTS